MPANYTRSYATRRGCANPRCDDLSARRSITGLCPSCQLIGRVAFTLGALIAGLLVKLLS